MLSSSSTYPSVYLDIIIYLKIIWSINYFSLVLPPKQKRIPFVLIFLLYCLNQETRRRQNQTECFIHRLVVEFLVVFLKRALKLHYELLFSLFVSTACQAVNHTWTGVCLSWVGANIPAQEDWDAQPSVVTVGNRCPFHSAIIWIWAETLKEQNSPRNYQEATLLRETRLK